MDAITPVEGTVYAAPKLSELGTVTESTLGSAGNDNADDTQYYQ